MFVFAGDNAFIHAATQTCLRDKPLLLDARLVPLQGYKAPGWKTEASLPFWWNRFFQGVLTADKPGAPLQLSVRGTAIRVFFVMNQDYGSFFVNLDGGVPRQVFTNTRDGYSSVLLDDNLPARAHMLTAVLPAKSDSDPRLNGQHVLVFDGPHPRPYFMPVQLKPGPNEFFLKPAAGSAGHGFKLRVAKVSQSG